MSSRDRYCSSRLRRPTSSSSPRRLWWSCLCTLRCSVRSWIRRVSSATWTSGEPVSPSLVACPAMISFFTVVSSGTLLPIVVNVLGAPADHLVQAGRESTEQIAWLSRLVSRLRAQPTGPATPGRSIQYHADIPHPARKPGPATARPALLPAPRRGAGRADVAVHLGHQLVDGVEPDHPAEPGREVHRDMGAVEVQVIPVQRVGLDDLVGPVEGRVDRKSTRLNS